MSGTNKKVIVGVADFAQIPEMDKSLRTINYADREDVSTVKLDHILSRLLMRQMKIWRPFVTS